MIRKIGLSALVICLLLGLIIPGVVQARSGPAVLNSSVAMDFPASLNFRLSAASDVNITDIRLHYMVERIEHAQVTAEVYMEFEPATRVDTKWTWDMRKTGGLPPGSNVRYWWTLEDVNGNKLETEPTIVQIEDNRYDWQSLTRGKVTLYWYKGGGSFAQELMEATQQVLVRLADDTGAEPDKPVKIYIYANSQDLRGSMIYPQEWTGGVTFTQYGIIAIGIAPNQLDWGIGAIAHELTHLVIHQVTFNPYGDLPTWLDEGLAMYAEGKLETSFVALLDDAISKDVLISVRSLSSPFSAYAEESTLAYAESYSLVEFLIDNYGGEKMFELLNTFRQGSGYDEALVRVYGFDMDSLNEAWRDSVGANAQPVKSGGGEGVSPMLIWVLVALAIGFVLAFSIVAVRGRRQ